MLGDECPNARCYGVPLVRPPKAGGEKDPRKECVICGGVYITEVDWAGRERLISAAGADVQPDDHNNATTSRIPQASPPQEAYQVSSPSPPEPVIIAPSVASTAAVYQQPERSLVQISDPLHALEESSLALQITLKSLSVRLGALSSQIGTDPSSIGLTADAIGKVTQALSQVRALQWSESQAQRV
ncbi:hypothetical protein DXG03_009151 [Asterophora parasitica]|uniref:Uncharacterized protein n=1 Tax=Asterophora parasitica TaxID=117018 RepID=A0A9P7G6H7_9AGAR|nr:hypothetical protein DXG03_009151 [Asterophora parasitica]